MTDLARTDPYNTWVDETPAPARIDLKRWAEEFRDVYNIAEALCKTPFVPPPMIGRQADVAAAIMKGRELGLDPFDALGSIYIVHGRVGFYAEFMRRRIVQAGHTLTIIESTENRCIIEGTRKDTGQKHRAQFTAEQARRAGIDLGKYPADKLIARATSRLCTQAFPDVLSGTLIAEDLIDGVIPPTDDDNVTDYTTATGPAGPPVQRKHPTKPPKAARTQPKPAQPKPPDNDIEELLGDTDQAGSGDETKKEQTPEQLPLPPDPATTPDTPASPAQNRKMWALLREIGLDKDEQRDDCLTIISHILGYTATHRTGATTTEINTIITTIKRWQDDPYDDDGNPYPIDDRINDILNQAAINQATQEEQP